MFYRRRNVDNIRLKDSTPGSGIHALLLPFSHLPAGKKPDSQKLPLAETNCAKKPSKDTNPYPLAFPHPTHLLHRGLSVSFASRLPRPTVTVLCSDTVAMSNGSPLFCACGVGRLSASACALELVVGAGSGALGGGGGAGAVVPAAAAGTATEEEARMKESEELVSAAGGGEAVVSAAAEDEEGGGGGVVSAALLLKGGVSTGGGEAGGGGGGGGGGVATVSQAAELVTVTVRSKVAATVTVAVFSKVAATVTVAWVKLSCSFTVSVTVAVSSWISVWVSVMVSIMVII